jgi:transposase
MLKLSPGQAGDAPQGRELLEAGVPPNPQRLAQWEYDRVVYRRRNEIERLFRRLKGYRRVFSRFDKLDVLFSGFIVLALIFEALRVSVNTP